MYKFTVVMQGKKETVEEAILRVIGWYKSLPPDNCDIVNIIHARRSLATYGVSYSIEIGKARTKWRRAEFRYETKRNEASMKFYKIEKSLERAKLYAKVNTTDLFNAVIEAEAEYYSKDYIARAVTEVLGEINQRIAILREQLKEDKYFSKG